MARLPAFFVSLCLCVSVFVFNVSSFATHHHAFAVASCFCDLHTSRMRLSCSPYEIAAAYHEEEGFAFLDSSRNDGDQGRYSILAWQPRSVIRVKNEDPFPAIERLLRSGMGGGVIGYFSYDLFRFLEHYDNLKAIDDLALPDCCLMAYDNVFIFDHQTN